MPLVGAPELPASGQTLCWTHPALWPRGLGRAQHTQLGLIKASTSVILTYEYNSWVLKAAL